MGSWVLINARWYQTDTFSTVFFNFASILGLNGTFGSLIIAYPVYTHTH